jgi:hypothetical protein
MLSILFHLYILNNNIFVDNNNTMETRIINSEIVQYEAGIEYGIQEIRLSDNDVVMPRISTQILFIYENVDDVDSKRMKLIASLKAVMMHYPEIAGQLEDMDKGDLNLKLNNTGIIWYNCKGDFSLQSCGWLLESGRFEQTAVPKNLVRTDPKYLFSVTFTQLHDNAIVVGITLHHCIADGPATFRLCKLWSDVCNDKVEKIARSSMSREMLYGNGTIESTAPQEYMTTFDPAIFKNTKPITAATYLIDKTKLNALRTQISDDLQKRISDNDVICGLIWSKIVAARRTGDALIQQNIRLGMAVNCRKRLKLHDDYFGNVNFYSLTQLDQRQLCDDYESVKKAASAIRESVDAITSDHIRNSINWISAQSNKKSILASFVGGNN